MIKLKFNLITLNKLHLNKFIAKLVQVAPFWHGSLAHELILF